MRFPLATIAMLAACSDPALPIAPDAAPPYNLTWTCPAGCPSPYVDLTRTTTLAIVGLTLTYGGGPGGAVHTATDVAGCFHVDQAAEASTVRSAYDLCPDGTGYEARISWTPGGYWRVQAWR